MSRAVLYARVSSKDQEVEGFSIPAQIKFLQEYAGKKGYTVVKVFTDAETAKKAGRSQFNEMLNFIEQHDVQHLLVEKTDRLLRNMSDYVLIKRLISSSDISVHLCKESTILGREARSDEKLIFGIKAVMAENYIDNLSEEVRKGMLEKAAQGTYPSWAPYGYINTKTNGKKTIAINPEEAPYVKKMFELYATGNYSLQSLRKKMLDDGMIYRNGKSFYKSKVELILKNEFYTGVFYWSGRKYENASHDPIISKELFNQVQAMFDKSGKSKSRKDLFPYTNMITCGVCGCALTAEIKKEKYIYYRCTGYKGNCKQKYIRQEALEDEFARLLSGIQITQEQKDLILDGMRESLEDKIEYHNHCINKIEKQLKVLQNRLDQAYLDKLDGHITEEFWQSQSRKWAQEKEALAMQMVSHQKADANYIKNADIIFELAQKAATVFDRANVEQKRALINLVVSNCSYKDGNLDVELKPVFHEIFISAKSEDWCARQDSNLRPTD